MVRLSCKADECKLSPHLVFNAKLSLVGIKFLDNAVDVQPKEKKMDTHLMIDWTDSVWQNWPGANLGARAVLVLNSFRSQITNHIKEKLVACHTDLVITPGGTISQIQSLNMYLIQRTHHGYCTSSIQLLAG